MYAELDAPSNDIRAMNLAIAAIDRWLENASDDIGEEVGRGIAAMYREIHAVVSSISPEDDDEEDEEEGDEEIVDISRGVAV
jgi:hypothetical protein